MKLTLESLIFDLEELDDLVHLLLHLVNLEFHLLLHCLNLELHCSLDLVNLALKFLNLTFLLVDHFGHLSEMLVLSLHSTSPSLVDVIHESANVMEFQVLLGASWSNVESVQILVVVHVLVDFGFCSDHGQVLHHIVECVA